MHRCPTAPNFDAPGFHVSDCRAPGFDVSDCRALGRFQGTGNSQRDLARCIWSQCYQPDSFSLADTALAPATDGSARAPPRRPLTCRCMRALSLRKYSLPSMTRIIADRGTGSRKMACRGRNRQPASRPQGLPLLQGPTIAGIMPTMSRLRFCLNSGFPIHVLPGA